MDDCGKKNLRGGRVSLGCLMSICVFLGAVALVLLVVEVQKESAAIQARNKLRAAGWTFSGDKTGNYAISPWGRCAADLATDF